MYSFQEIEHGVCNIYYNETVIGKPTSKENAQVIVSWLNQTTELRCDQVVNTGMPKTFLVE